MAGFITIISKKGNTEQISPAQWMNFFPYQTTETPYSIQSDHFRIDCSISNKFFEEKLQVETDEFIFITTGVLHNLELLRKQHQAPDNKILLEKLHKKDKEFFKYLDGSFVGFYYHKQQDTWYAFNNISGSKRLYYYNDSKYLIFSTGLKKLTQTLFNLKINFTPDTLAARMMLNSGFIFEEHTPVKEIKKVRAGEYFVYKNGNLNCNFYFHLNTVLETKDSKDEIIAQLDNKFKNAVSNLFDLNNKYGYQNLTTISAGLDSRMTAITAHKLGYTNQQWINFSEPGYIEEVIAVKIAKKYNYPLHQFDLNADSLLPIDAIIAVNEGQGIYTGCSHIFSTLNRFDSTKTGLIHTGVMGDTIMGSYANNNKSITERRLFASNNILNSEFDEYKKTLHLQYASNLEMAVVYNTIFNNESNGFLYFDLIGSTVSPFLERAFMEYAFSIPRKYKLNRNLYIDWIKQLHPDMAAITWETIGGKPTNNPTKLIYYRLKRAALKRIPLSNKWKKGMNPEQLWFDSNETVQIKLNQYFYENLERINDRDLRHEVENLYIHGNFDDKAKCLTVLATMKLLFDESPTKHN